MGDTLLICALLVTTLVTTTSVIGGHFLISGRVQSWASLTVSGESLGLLGKALTVLSRSVWLYAAFPSSPLENPAPPR